MAKILTIAVLSVSALGIAKGQMVRNDSIGNDPAREKLCIERTNAGIGFHITGKPLSFEIDLAYVARVRSHNPEATFVVLDDGAMAWLVQCQILGGNGRFQALTVEDESGLNYGRYWRLPSRPPRFQPGIDTPQGIDAAVQRCFKAGVAKINRPNLDHTTSYRIVTEVRSDAKGTRYRTGMRIGGITVERFDVVTTGTAIYKTGGIDMDAIDFTCLFSPMLEVKAVEIDPPSRKSKK